MKSTFSNIRYELLPEYTENSQLTDLFLEHKFWGWFGLLAIFILICLVLYFQFKIWDTEDKLEKKKVKEWKRRSIKEKDKDSIF
tara:strand:+ start:216 stop:467 length:252 start_codon:yes stop_codon:yes gene_type:complete